MKVSFISVECIFFFCSYKLYGYLYIFLYWSSLPAFCHSQESVKPFVTTHLSAFWKAVLQLDSICAIVPLSPHSLQSGFSVSPYLHRLLGDGNVSLTDRSMKEILIDAILQSFVHVTS